MKENTHKIELLVSNSPGALIRIALPFSRVGCNIESVAVYEVKNSHTLKKMFITVSGDTKTINLSIRKISKLIDVIEVF